MRLQKIQTPHHIIISNIHSEFVSLHILVYVRTYHILKSGISFMCIRAFPQSYFPRFIYIALIFYVRAHSMLFTWCTDGNEYLYRHHEFPLYTLTSHTPYIFYIICKRIYFLAMSAYNIFKYTHI